MSLPRRPNKKENTSSKDMTEVLEALGVILDNKEENPEWRKNNLEYDLRSTDWILQKVKNSDSYAQNLYAAMCNNEFQKSDTWCILSDKEWSCSWRYAGGIIADMQEKGDYIDWYCSGIRNDAYDVEIDLSDLTDQKKQYIISSKKFVSEGVVTDEIRDDLKKLGWVVLPNDK